MRFIYNLIVKEMRKHKTLRLKLVLAYFITPEQIFLGKKFGCHDIHV